MGGMRREGNKFNVVIVYTVVKYGNWDESFYEDYEHGELVLIFLL